VWPELLCVLAAGESMARPWQPQLDAADIAPQRPQAWAALAQEYAADEVLRLVVQVSSEF
jgi:hypothetical protein